MKFQEIYTGIAKSVMTSFKIKEIEIAAKNRAKGRDNVLAEYIVFAHPTIYYHLSKLFELIIKHGHMYQMNSKLE